MAEEDFEKLGVFYLGRRYDLQNHKLTDELCLYDSKDLVTHAVCIGMTGSGKTGLCLGLIEEAAIDGIPVIAIDPKGDIGNLLLTFPQLRGKDFEPWVDADQARRSALSTGEFAEQQAKLWKDGLAQWDESGERIQRLKDSAEFAIYTPGASYGIPVSILSSFNAPPPSVLEDPDALHDRVASTTSSILALLGIEGDPLRSREHILISNILQSSWQQSKDLTLPALIQAIQKPPIAQIGALDVESFYPAKERFELAMLLNNLLASPGFDAWMQGEPLELDRLLYTAEGKPRVSIFSIAHLDDSKRMFFVSLLLNQVLAWMRAQSGTSSLRAMFYMDEIFGYFPPTANPPSKTPLLTLMKQARAFGLGVVLATQNPVDIEYKGLSNAGTWFIGRLQTERDKMRVLDGLEGAAANAGSGFNRADMDKTLSQLGSRVFLMNNVHEDRPTIFLTRWTLSYLAGPLSREQIKQLKKQTQGGISPVPIGSGDRLVTPVDSGGKVQASTKAASASPAVAASAPAATRSNEKVATASGAQTNKPLLSPGIAEYYLPVRQVLSEGTSIVYKPKIIAVGNVRFTDTKASVDTTLQYTLLADSPGGGMPTPDWDAAQPAKVWMEQLKQEAEQEGAYDPLPPGLGDAKAYAAWSKQFATWLYNAKKLKLFKSELTGVYSKPRENERDFRIRLSQSAREQRDQAAEALKAKYQTKVANLEDELRRAQQALETQQMQARDQQIQSAISVGATVLGAFMGRRRITTTTIERAATSARRVGRNAKEQQDVEHAQETVETVSSQLAQLNSQFSAEMQQLEGKFDPLSTELSEVSIAPKKTNIAVPMLALAWAPYVRNAEGREIPAWLAASATG